MLKQTRKTSPDNPFEEKRDDELCSISIGKSSGSNSQSDILLEVI